MLSVPSVFTRSSTSRKGLSQSNEEDYIDEDEQQFYEQENDNLKLFSDPESDHITLLNMY